MQKINHVTNSETTIKDFYREKRKIQALFLIQSIKKIIIWWTML
jgi:hypothetical protein